MGKLASLVAVVGSALIVSAPAQAVKISTYRPAPVPRWRLTPTPHRPLLPRAPRDPGLSYDLPGPSILWPGHDYWRAASNWYPIGSYINLRMPPHSQFRANAVGTGPGHLGPGSGPRCRWTNPVVEDALKPGTLTRLNNGERWIGWRVKATNRGNVVTVTEPPRDTFPLEDWVNYSNAFVRITIRCAPVGPQEPLVSLGGGIWVGGTATILGTLDYWPDPNYPWVMPNPALRSECVPPFSPSGTDLEAKCKALGWL